MSIALYTTVAHNNTQNRPHDFLSYHQRVIIAQTMFV